MTMTFGELKKLTPTPRLWALKNIVDNHGSYVDQAPWEIYASFQETPPNDDTPVHYEDLLSVVGVYIAVWCMVKVVDKVDAHADFAYFCNKWISTTPILIKGGSRYIPEWVTKSIRIHTLHREGLLTDSECEHADWEILESSVLHVRDDDIYRSKQYSYLEEAISWFTLITFDKEQSGHYLDLGLTYAMKLLQHHPDLMELFLKEAHKQFLKVYCFK